MPIKNRSATRDVILQVLRPTTVEDPTGGVSQPLETPRLFIEPIRCEHARDLYHVLRDPGIYAFIPEEPPSSEEALRARIARLVKGPEPAIRELWFNWVVRTKDEGKIVGSLQSTLYVDRRSASVAYLFGPAYWGHGFAREGVGAVLGWLRARRDVRVIEALVDARNLRSIRLLRGLGFQLIKTEFRAGYFKGSWSDEHLFRLPVVRRRLSRRGGDRPSRTLRAPSAKS